MNTKYLCSRELVMKENISLCCIDIVLLLRNHHVSELSVFSKYY